MDRTIRDKEFPKLRTDWILLARARSEQAIAQRGVLEIDHDPCLSPPPVSTESTSHLTACAIAAYPKQSLSPENASLGER
jgi:hypothetical protein